jgi:hypothetical protein
MGWAELNPHGFSVMRGNRFVPYFRWSCVAIVLDYIDPGFISACAPDLEQKVRVNGALKRHHFSAK